MRRLFHFCFLFVIAGLMLSNPSRVNAFALLGPLEPWMTASNGFTPLAYDYIGGPMCISNGYRWNVPKVTCRGAPPPAISHTIISRLLSG